MERERDPLRVERDGWPVNLAGLWSPCPAFLVCGGPSLQDFDLNRLKDRGVVSLGVNNASAFAPIKAWVFSDEQVKFHHGLFLDPAVMTFAPSPKLHHRFYIKTAEGFRRSAITIGECPNTYGFERYTCFIPRSFFTTSFAHWGPGKHQWSSVPPIGTLCTMLIGLRLLHYLGVKTIFLLGVDFKGRDGLCYGFPNDKAERNRRYQWETEMLAALQRPMRRKGIQVFNCSETSDCKLFPFRPFNEALACCKGSVPDEPFDTTVWYSKDKTKAEAETNPPLLPQNFVQKGSA